MRAADRREILCQLEPGSTGSDAALACYYATPEGCRFVAFIDGQPVAAFGIGPLTYVVWQGWAFGTNRIKRTIPAISRFMQYELAPAIIANGCRRIEARAYGRGDIAPLWISRLGGIRVPGDLSDHGRDGEVFELWAWTLSAYERRNHVLQGPQGEGSPEAGRD